MPDKTVQLGQGSREKTSGTWQPIQDSQERTGWTGEAGQNTGQTGMNCRDRTVGTARRPPPPGSVAIVELLVRLLLSGLLSNTGMELTLSIDSIDV
jgi:hypothetical protein